MRKTWPYLRITVKVSQTWPYPSRFLSANTGGAPGPGQQAD